MNVYYHLKLQACSDPPFTMRDAFKSANLSPWDHCVIDIDPW